MRTFGRNPSKYSKKLESPNLNTALDVTIQAQILDLMKKLQRETGMAIIFITHDLGVIAETCQEVVVMYAGKVAESAATIELFKNAKQSITLDAFTTFFGPNGNIDNFFKYYLKPFVDTNQVYWVTPHIHNQLKHHKGYRAAPIYCLGAIR